MTGEARAWGWVDHLRAGGTVPWGAWRGDADPDPAASLPGASLPGAQQLELLRRLNEQRAGRPVAAPLARRVLSASAVGRGRPDLPLVGVGPTRFGPPPVDPAALPAHELLRLASGLLAEDLLAAGVPAAPPAARPRPWRVRYRLVGDPWLADPRRAALVERGHPPGGRHPRVLVLGGDLQQTLSHIWTARSVGLGAAVWSRWVDRMVRADALPPQADLARVAERWAAQVGPSRVRIVLDPDAVPRLAGVRRALPGRPPLSADAGELGRRVGEALGLLAPPAQRQELLRGHLLPRLLRLPGAPLRLPERHAAWLRRQAVRVRDEVRAAGYPVVGDADRLLPGASTGVAAPRDEAVLALAVRLLLENGRP